MSTNSPLSSVNTMISAALKSEAHNTIRVPRSAGRVMWRKLKAAAKAKGSDVDVDGSRLIIMNDDHPVMVHFMVVMGDTVNVTLSVGNYQDLYLDPFLHDHSFN